MRELDGDGWRSLAPSGQDAAAVLAVARAQVGVRAADGDGAGPDTEAPLLLAVTGGVAAGKTTFADEVAAAGGGIAVGADGFLLTNAELEQRGLTERKGYPESFDREALGSFLAAVAAGRPASAPVYSHLHYDVVPGASVDVGGHDVVVVEGLHLGTPALGIRHRFALVVHLDAGDDDQERWFLERFQALRRAAADDPTAFLHAPLQSMGAEGLDAFALGVWHAVNLPLLHEHVRPAAEHADVVLHLGPDHRVERAILRVS